MNELPTVSIVIPTHNRQSVLRKTLDTLCAQTYPGALVEVIVVADGCTDGTAEMVAGYPTTLALRLLEQDAQGAAVARNLGAASATGHLLLFLDDDIEAMPSLVEAHVRARQSQPDCVVVGYLPPVLDGPECLLCGDVRAWWEQLFYEMRQVGHRFTYKDLLSGNFSIPANLFARLGGFDTGYLRLEDYEFGLRLVKENIPFIFAPDAMGYHHDTCDLDRSYRRARQEARFAVELGRRHPELRDDLRLAHSAYRASPPYRLLHYLAFAAPRLGDWLADRMRRRLDLLERMRLRGHWRRLSFFVRSYWYWRGVADAVGTRQCLDRYVQSSQIRGNGHPLEIEVDLKQGIETAERQVDAERPDGLRVLYGGQLVGYIRPQPGAERLRGVHLRPALATQLAVPLLLSLGMDRATGDGAGVRDSLRDDPVEPVPPVPVGREVASGRAGVDGKLAKAQ